MNGLKQAQASKKTILQQAYINLLSSSPQQTLEIGFELGKMLSSGMVLLLEGPLGSGKTLFVKGIGQSLGIKDPSEIRSPTFDLIQEHQGMIPLCHADLYRLSENEIGAIGLEEYFSSWIVAVEWGEKLEKLLPSGSKNALRIRFSATAPQKRKITFSGNLKWKEKLKKLSQKF